MRTCWNQRPQWFQILDSWTGRRRLRRRLPRARAPHDVRRTKGRARRVEGVALRHRHVEHGVAVARHGLHPREPGLHLVPDHSAELWERARASRTKRLVARFECVWLAQVHVGACCTGVRRAERVRRGAYGAVALCRVMHGYLGRCPGNLSLDDGRRARESQGIQLFGGDQESCTSDFGHAKQRVHSSLASLRSTPPGPWCGPPAPSDSLAALGGIGRAPEREALARPVVERQQRPDQHGDGGDDGGVLAGGLSGRCRARPGGVLGGEHD